MHINIMPESMECFVFDAAHTFRTHWLCMRTGRLDLTTRLLQGKSHGHGFMAGAPTSVDLHSGGRTMDVALTDAPQQSAAMLRIMQDRRILLITSKVDRVKGA